MQGTLSNNKIRAKEKVSFDSAMNELENVYWNSSKFNWFPVLVKTIVAMMTWYGRISQ